MVMDFAFDHMPWVFATTAIMFIPWVRWMSRLRIPRLVIAFTLIAKYSWVMAMIFYVATNLFFAPDWLGAIIAGWMGVCGVTHSRQEIEILQPKPIEVFLARK